MASCSNSGDNAVSDCTNNACVSQPDGNISSGTTGGGPDEGGSGVDSGPSRNLLCGVTGCDPGNVSACGAPGVDGGPYRFPGAEASDDWDAGADGAARGADTSVEASDAGTSPGAAPPEAGAPDAITADAGSLVDAALADDAGALDDAAPSDDASLADDASAAIVSGDSSAASDAAATDSSAADEPKTVEACYLKPSPFGIQTACAPVGAGADGSPCQDSSECGALLACVDVDGKSVCRQLRCELPPQCPAGTFYQETPLRVSGATSTDFKVPVCLPNDHCAILAAVNPCSGGEVCAIVGSKGETTCIFPGMRKERDACDEANRCGEGLVCSKFSNTCFKLCHIDTGKQECPGGACQGGNQSIPDKFGICVGETSDGG
jgi:hypothetical protein